MDEPEIGMVIRHLYLWRSEQRKGQEEGLKARPCVIVHKRQVEDDTEVFICPITHTPPHDEEAALEIPLKTKQRLKLDDDQSWIVTSEVNSFTWVGPDVQKTQSGAWSYGYLSERLIKETNKQIVENSRGRNLDVVERDDPFLKSRLAKGKDRER